MQWADNEFFLIKADSKSPLAKTNGFYDAKAGMLEELLKDVPIKHNLAIRPHESMLVIDIDPRNGGLEAEEAILGLNKWPDTWTVNTAGGGRHIYLQIDGTHKLPSKLATGIDIKGRNGYLVCPPSVVNGRSYEWADELSPDDVELAKAPVWLTEMLRHDKEHAPVSDTASEIDLVSKRNDAALILPNIDPDLPYPDWVRVGMVLFNIRAFELWENWSARGRKYKEGECAKKWGTFTKGPLDIPTLHWFAKEYALRPVSIPTPEPKTEPSDELIEYKFEGFFARCVEFFTTATAGQREYAIGSTLAIVSTCLQRTHKVSLPSGELGLQSVYVVLAGLSGTRKTESLRLVRDFIRLINKSYVLGDIRSASAFKKELSFCPSRIYTADEIGRHLRSNVYTYKKDPQAEQIHRLLLELYGSPSFIQANKTMHKEHSTEEVLDPRLTMLGTGVVADFVALLGHPEFLSDGMLSRLLLFEGMDVQQATPFDLLTPRKSAEFGTLVDDLIFCMSATSVGPGTEKWQPVTKEIDERAARYAMRLMSTHFLPLTAEPETRSIVERLAYTGLLIASWHAICAHRAVTDADVDVGMGIMLPLVRRTLQRLKEAEGGGIEKGITVALGIIKAKGPIAWRDVYRNSNFLNRLEHTSRAAILRGLIDSGYVKKIKMSGKEALSCV
jgi:hypothetical protein